MNEQVRRTALRILIYSQKHDLDEFTRRDVTTEVNAHDAIVSDALDWLSRESVLIGDDPYTISLLSYGSVYETECILQFKTLDSIELSAWYLIYELQNHAACGSKLDEGGNLTSITEDSCRHREHLISTADEAFEMHQLPRAIDELIDAQIVKVDTDGLLSLHNFEYVPREQGGTANQLYELDVWREMLDSFGYITPTSED